tara:strand:+ start:1926 stop:2276 length:351 start_codon:yes stop_codon:yes gene_type:complete
MKHEEHYIQVSFLEWFKLKHSKHFVYAIPNGEKREIKTAIRLKKEGVVAGVPDLNILLDNGKSFFLEIKTEKGKLNKNQKSTISEIEKRGYEVLVCYGIDDIIKQVNNTINNYLQI